MTVELYVEGGQVLRKGRQSSMVLGSFFVLVGGLVLIPVLWFLPRVPRGDLVRLVLYACVFSIPASFVFAGVLHILIGIRTPGLMVTREGIYVSPARSTSF